MDAMINTVLAQMQPVLDHLQLKQLKAVLESALYSHAESSVLNNSSLLDLFLTAKEVEGCSPRTITYYESTLKHMDSSIGQPYTKICSDDLRKYLSDYESSRSAGKVTIDNIRRIMSSFFSWLEDEDYIVKSPVRRIRRVKTATTAKEILSDEDLETLRDNCPSLRDLAIVDMLASTGMRVGELVGLNISDVNLQERYPLLPAQQYRQEPGHRNAAQPVCRLE